MANAQGRRFLDPANSNRRARPPHSMIFGPILWVDAKAELVVRGTPQLQCLQLRKVSQVPFQQCRLLRPICSMPIPKGGTEYALKVEPCQMIYRPSSIFSVEIFRVTAKKLLIDNFQTCNFGANKFSAFCSNVLHYLLGIESQAMQDGHIYVPLQLQ